MTDDIKKYTIEEHRHRFACGAASRAAHVITRKDSKVAKSLNVKDGIEVLEYIGFTKEFRLDDLPESYDGFNKKTSHMV